MVVTTAPLPGVVIVAPRAGGGDEIVPCIPTEPDDVWFGKFLSAWALVSGHINNRLTTRTATQINRTETANFLIYLSITLLG
jgi:hypothetical protein